MDKFAEILEKEKDYKNLFEIKTFNSKQIYQAILIIKQYINENNLILYGGTAIDYALKSIGHQGIYKNEIFPDYDFFTGDPIKETHKICQVLYDNGFEQVNKVPALFPTTRRVRITKVDYIADVSYYPQVYLNLIPVLKYDGFTIVHPDFQRIDIHISLSLLYTGYDKKLNYASRLEKDVKRFNILRKNFPIQKYTEVDPEPYFVFLFNGVLSRQKIKTGMCVAGIAAYGIYCEMIKKICKDGIKKPDIKFCKIENDEIETDYCEYFFTDKEPPFNKKMTYNKTLDIFPPCVVEGKEIIYDSYGMLYSSSFCRFSNVVGIHRLCASFLFKYLMTRVPLYLEFYEDCIKIIDWADKINVDRTYYPFYLNGRYYGNLMQNTDARSYLNKMAQKKNIEVYPPESGFKNNITPKEVNFKDYPSFQIDGSKI